MRGKLSDMDALLRKPQYSPDVFIEGKKKKKKIRKMSKKNCQNNNSVEYNKIFTCSH